MSESHLPDDYRSWPNDPYELLGVDHSVSDRDLKRAYTRLIRLYKPEHSPNQFRLIREAYESLQNRYRGDWSFLPTSLPKDTSEDHDDPSLSDDANHNKLSLDTIWNRAVEGNCAEAYQEFRELNRLEPTRVTLYLRLYWLLHVDRSIESDREPADWLVEGLLQCKYAEELVDLYLLEIEQNKKEALHDRCQRLLQMSLPTPILTKLLTACWDALLELHEWDQILLDFDNFKQRIANDNEMVWLYLVCRVREWLTWKDILMSSMLLKRVSDEVNMHQSLGTHQNYILERYDLLQDVLASLKRIEQDPDYARRTEQLRNFIRKAWLNQDMAKREDVISFSEEIANSGLYWIEFLNELATIGDYAVSYVNNLLSNQFWTEMKKSPDRAYLCDRFDELARAFDSTFITDLSNLQVTKIDENYVRARRSIVKFCIDEITTPEELWTLYSPAERYIPELLLQSTHDLPLSVVSRCVRIFRS